MRNSPTTMICPFKSVAFWIATFFLLVQTPTPVSGEWTELTSQEFYDLKTAGGIDAMFDVRTREEFETGHIENATLVESLGSVLTDSDDLQGTLQDLSLWGCRNCRIVVYCRSGRRAATALDLLVQAGFAGQLYNGLGTSQWLEAGYELATTPSTIAPCMRAPIVHISSSKQVDDDTAYCRAPPSDPENVPTASPPEEYPEPTFEGQETEESLLIHQEELNAAEHLFRTQLAIHNARTYQFAFTLTCFCVPANYPWLMTVRVGYEYYDIDWNVTIGNNNTLTSSDPSLEVAVMRSSSNISTSNNTGVVAGDRVISAVTTTGQDILQMNETYLNTYSILDLFGKIQEAIDEEAHDIMVVYNKEWGFPEQISIDYSFMLADEELYITTSNFTVVDYFDGYDDIDLEQGDGSPPSPLQTEFNTAYSLWKSAGLTEYYFQYSWPRGIFLNYPWSTHVQDGTVSSVTDADGEDVILMPEADRTMEDIFAAVQRGIEEDAFNFKVDYDETYGFPVYVWIDFDTMIVDEETSITVSYFSTEGFPRRAEE